MNDLKFPNQKYRLVETNPNNMIHFINNLMMYLKVLENQEQSKSKLVQGRKL